MNMPMPENLEVVDLSARTFPASWRDAAIRLSYDRSIGGVACMRCGKVFCGLAGLRIFEADHKVAWTDGRLTTWENLELLCRPCNRTKGRGK